MKSRMLRNASRAAALALGFAASAGALAQESTSGLWGRAADSDRVHIRHVGTNFQRVLPVRHGRFQIERLPVGIYEVRIRHADGSEDRPILAWAKLGLTRRVNFG